MGYEHSVHVARLNSMQPFDADFSRIFFEHGDHTDPPLETKASEAIKAFLTDPSTRVIVLTGDAGHGKTHLCAQVLAHELGYADDLSAVIDLINSRCDGDVEVATLSDGRELWIIKDLSEVGIPEASQMLTDAIEAESRVTLIAANEGRLRSAIHANPEHLADIRETLDDSIRFGSTRSGSGHAIIIDLNHQSVAPPTPDNLIQQVLERWVSDESRWSECQECDARSRCPVFENHRLLSDTGVAGSSRRLGIETLLRTAERTGHVITIRELLIAMAHAITGGLQCSEIHDLVKGSDAGDWQWRHLFHQTLFGDLVPADTAIDLDVFRGLGRLDPGKRAVRGVDDSLDPMIADGGQAFTPPVHAPGDGAAPTNRRQRRAEQQRHRDLWQMLRRRSFFDADTDEDLPGMRARLGLLHVDEFAQLVGEDGEADTKKIRDQLLRGLEAIQGVHRKGMAKLMIVDPAFSTGHGLGARGFDAARVIAGDVPFDRISIGSQSEAWNAALGSDRSPDIPDSVDWIERRVVIAIRPEKGVDPVRIELDLRAFEFVMSAAEGLDPHAFFAPEERRILNHLAALAPAGETGEVVVFTGRKPRVLLIDDGSTQEVDG